MTVLPFPAALARPSASEALAELIARMSLALWERKLFMRSGTSAEQFAAWATLRQAGFSVRQIDDYLVHAVKGARLFAAERECAQRGPA
jgi:hypothetical protein